MIYIWLNIIPILAATVVGLAAGTLLFRLAGRRAAIATPILGTAFLAEFWIASILAGALILAPDEAGAWTMALGTAVVIWIGFVAPAIFVTDRSRGASLGQTATDAVHWLVVMVIQVAVLEAIGLTPPPTT